MRKEQSEMVWRQAYAYAYCHTTIKHAISFADYYYEHLSNFPIVEAFENWNANLNRGAERPWWGTPYETEVDAHDYA